jgi:hypothetical protein
MARRVPPTLAPGPPPTATVPADPADGAGLFVGLAGPGTDPPNDQFGRRGREKR